MGYRIEKFAPATSCTQCRRALWWDDVAVVLLRERPGGQREVVRQCWPCAGGRKPAAVEDEDGGVGR